MRRLGRYQEYNSEEVPALGECTSQKQQISLDIAPPLLYQVCIRNARQKEML